jgi:hypothetical protein
MDSLWHGMWIRDDHASNFPDESIRLTAKEYADNVKGVLLALFVPG